MQNWIDIAYLIAACLFVVGIKGLTKPKTAVRGNLLAAAGMGVAAVSPCSTSILLLMKSSSPASWSAV